MASRCTLIRPGLVHYQEGWQLQQSIATRVRDGHDDTLILLEHPPTYTLGARGNAEHVLLSDAALASRGVEVHRSDRGGDVTYHGPGQLVGYPIINLRRYGEGPSWYVRTLESVLIEVLAQFDVVGERSPRSHGVWVGNAKIAAIGVRISRGVTTHGFALNINNDLAYFQHIVPCGLPDAGVTSMQHLTNAVPTMREVEGEVVQAFSHHFGVTVEEDGRAVELSATAAGSAV